VRALVRSQERAQPLQQAGAELVIGDIHSTAKLSRLVAGSDAVVHLAGAVRGNGLQQFLQTNCEGTRLLLHASAAAAPGARFLLLSSLAAREPQLSWYSHSKREAESLVTASGLDWSVIRPPAVYGPGDEEMKAIFDWMARGIALVPGHEESRTSLIHVDDLVEAVIACLVSDNASGQVLEMGDGKRGGYDWADLADIAAAVYDRPVRLLRLPAWLLDAVARANLAIARLTGRAAMLTPPKLRELRHDDWVTDNAAITATTGWTPAIPLREGLAALRKSAL
jgi:nucleoside-diphosphate-sugar epimerase